MNEKQRSRLATFQILLALALGVLIGHVFDPIAVGEALAGGEFYATPEGQQMTTYLLAVVEPVNDGLPSCNPIHEALDKITETPTRVLAYEIGGNLAAHYARMGYCT